MNTDGEYSPFDTPASWSIEVTDRVWPGDKVDKIHMERRFVENRVAEKSQYKLWPW